MSQGAREFYNKIGRNHIKPTLRLCFALFIYGGGEEGILGERSYDDHVMPQSHYPQSDVTSADISLGNNIGRCVLHPYKEKL